MDDKTGLWFWAVGGFGTAREIRHGGPLGGVNSIYCYTCSANFAWPAGVSPVCPICKSSNSRLYPSVVTEFTVEAGYVRG